MIARNMVATYKALQSSGFSLRGKILPPMLGHYGRTCKNCSEHTACVLYHYVFEKGDGETSGFGDELFDSMTQHVKTPARVHYFAKWDRLIDLEMSKASRHNLSSLNFSSHKREESSTAICALRLVAARDAASQYTYTFSPCCPAMRENALFWRAAAHYAVGDAVVLSTGSGYLCAMQGFLSSIKTDAVEVVLKSPLRPPTQGLRLEDSVWVIDKNELLNSFQIARQV